MANNTTIKFDQIIGDINKRKFTPVYLLEGEETFYIDEITKELEEKVLKPEEKSFNQTIAYGKDISPLDIKMAAKRYPMMSEYQLIIIKEAQNISDIDQLEDYLEKPLDTTILVLCYKGKKVDKRKKVGKLFSKYTHFTSERLRDYEVSAWVEKHIRAQGRNIDPKAAQLISDYLGNDLGKIANEIEKMLINVKREVSVITEQHIEQNIGISKDYNVFELQKAIGQKNFNKAIQITHYFASNTKQHSIIPVIANLFSFFSKIYTYHTIKNKPKKDIALTLGINEFFVEEYRQASLTFHPGIIEQIFGYLKYYDLRSKGVNDTGTDEGQLMIEMVVRILRVAEIPVQLKIV